LFLTLWKSSPSVQPLIFTNLAYAATMLLSFFPPGSLRREGRATSCRAEFL
jgi:hypothetical protein